MEYIDFIPVRLAELKTAIVGVFLVYASSLGHTFIDRELYLPKSWTSDRTRCERAGVPENVEFATKLQISRKMLGRAIDAGVPARWVCADALCADALYGTDHRLRQFIEARGHSLRISGKP